MSLKIIGGSSHKQFTKDICEHLNIEETKTISFLFSNENRFVKIDESVRGDDVFVIQTQLPPVDAHIIELFILIRALKDASAKRITVVLPYFPYVRSDKKEQQRVVIAARLMADLLESSGANRVIIMEMHSPQIQGFFSIPTDHLIAAPDIIEYLRTKDLSNYTLVAADSGAIKMLEPYSDNLNLPVAMMDKRRLGNEEKVSIKGIIGDVRGKNALIIDDETSSGGTLIENAKYLIEKAGAARVDACIIHAALSPGTGELLNASPIKKFITTDTIPSHQHNLRDVKVVSVTKRFADVIHRIHEDKSVKSINDISS
jgi:ribose-phosphate pyrophosphokinase